MATRKKVVTKKADPSAELLALKAQLEKENAELKAKIAKAEEAADGMLYRYGITQKKTAATLYFHGFKFPLTLFPDQFQGIIDQQDELREHYIAHGLLDE